MFQIGTANYGVRDSNGQLDEAKLAEIAAHEQVRVFEIKLSQGAKPGKGCILPGAKVIAEIARIRSIPGGRTPLARIETPLSTTQKICWLLLTECVGLQVSPRASNRYLVPMAGLISCAR